MTAAPPGMRVQRPAVSRFAGVDRCTLSADF
jgi:hypothetical protein